MSIRTAVGSVVLVALAGGCGGGQTPPPRSGSTSTSTSLTAARVPLPAGDDRVVVRVVDGDTLVVRGDERDDETDDERVRLIGIDTPETTDPRTTVQCFGREAATRTAELVRSGTPVRLVYDVERNDRYGRSLAYVYRRADGVFVNAALVRGGYASAYTYPPNVTHAGEFVALQRQARAAARGLWGACNQQPPASDVPALPGAACDAAYPDDCILPPPPDLDCGDITARRFRVLAPDPHRFDSNGDGIGCEGR